MRVTQWALVALLAAMACTTKVDNKAAPASADSASTVGPATAVAVVPQEYYTSGGVATGLLADMWQLGGYLYEPGDNWWNLRVNTAPVDPNSAAIIITLVGCANGGRLHPDMTPT